MEALNIWKFAIFGLKLHRYCITSNENSFKEKLSNFVLVVSSNPIFRKCLFKLKN